MTKDKLKSVLWIIFIGALIIVGMIWSYGYVAEAQERYTVMLNFCIEKGYDQYHTGNNIEPGYLKCTKWGYNENHTSQEYEEIFKYDNS